MAVLCQGLTCLAADIHHHFLLHWVICQPHPSPPLLRYCCCSRGFESLPLPSTRKLFLQNSTTVLQDSFSIYRALMENIRPKQFAMFACFCRHGSSFDMTDDYDCCEPAALNQTNVQHFEPIKSKSCESCGICGFPSQMLMAAAASPTTYRSELRHHGASSCFCFRIQGGVCPAVTVVHMYK